MPVLEMEPDVVDHSTDVLLDPLTVAENCVVPPEATLVLVGFTLTLMLMGVDGEFTVTVAEAVAPRDATLVAVTVTEDVVETVGAVNKPVLEIEPAVVDQATAVLLDPLTVAKNC